MKTVIAQRWTDGTMTISLTNKDRISRNEEYWKKNILNGKPEGYSFETEVDDDTYNRIAESEHKTGRVHGNFLNEPKVG